jgi:hypothetical protein
MDLFYSPLTVYSEKCIILVIFEKVDRRAHIDFVPLQTMLDLLFVVIASASFKKPLSRSLWPHFY